MKIKTNQIQKNVATVGLIALLLFIGMTYFASTSQASSTSYTDVECSMEDHTCEKLILKQAELDAILFTYGFSEEPTLQLKKAVQIYRKYNPQTQLTDADIIQILSQQELPEKLHEEKI